MRLLIIEDDPALCEALKFHLEKEGYDVDLCLDGGEAGYYLSNGGYGAVVLDRMLPGVDGLTLLKELRRRGDATPVLVLTALGEVPDRTAGLDAGADDYLVKPFAMEELLSRLRALLRRPAALRQAEALEFAGYALDVAQCRLQKGEQALSLSKKEAALLELFFKNPGKVLPRAQILAWVWGNGVPVEEGNVDNYIYFIRRRLRALGGGAVVKNVHGVGYTLVRA